jgi:CRP-like cAMP-binding protein
MLKRLHFKRGDEIIRENDLGETAYIIQSGRVEITQGSARARLATVGPGETIGEMSMIDDKPRSATAVALEDTEVTEIHHDDFYEALQTDPEATIMILKALFERLREANTRYHQLLARHGGREPSTGDAAPGVALVLEPVTTEAGAALPEGTVRIDRFPFRIGRVSHNPLVHNDLELPDEMPWQISRHHLAFVIEDGRVGVVDRGSTLGSDVDGVRLGGPSGSAGPVFFSGSEGRLVLGSSKSPYEFRVVIQASSDG